MSREHVLLTLTDYTRLKAAAQATTTPGPAPVPPKNEQTLQMVQEEIKKEQASFEESIVKFLPKTYRNRARTLLQLLQPKVSPQGRIIYPDNTHGSHLLDLIKGVQVQFQKHKPSDLEKFITLLQDSDIPKSLYNIPAISKPEHTWLMFS